jgi:DNA anti-recombination protein RmuC
MISNSVENLDEDVLIFKGKLASYKKAFKEAYESADNDMYSFWEEFDKNLSKKYKSMSKKMDNINRIYENEFEKKKNQIERLSKSMESLNTYQFEKIINFLRSFESLSSESKELFKGLMAKETK